MSRPVYAPKGAQEARGTGYAVRGFLPAPFSPSPSPAHQCVARAADAGGTRFKSSSRGLPPRSPDSTPVCATGLSSIPSSGLPEAPLESRSWPDPVSRHRNFRRSATGGTSPDRSSGGRHARHRPDEGVRQSRPGHPGVGRFGSWFPRRGPDPEDRTSVAAFPRRPDGDTVGGPSAAPHRISRILSGADVESFSPVRRFRAVRPLPSAGDGTRASCHFSCRTARGVSIPARDVHGFLLRPLRTGRGLRFSEVRVAATQLQGPAAYGGPRGDAFLRHSVRLHALWPPRHGGPLAPASSAPASAPLRERSAHRTRIEAGPRGRSDMTSPPPAAPKRAMRILRLRKIVLLKPAARSKWRYGPCGWFQKDTLRVSVVRYDGCAARASGIQLSVYRVSADRIVE